MFNKYRDSTDDITLHFKPLDCSLADELGLAGNADFLSMCVSSTDLKPEIVVN